jgi:hypothetical protein
MLNKRIVTGNNWEVTFSAVAPGEYKVFAWERLPFGFGAEEDAEFLAKYEQRGRVVTLSDGETADIQVTVIPTSDKGQSR